MSTNLVVEFYNISKENKRLSREQGRPIFEDKEYVRIKFPGDRKRVHCAPAAEKSALDPRTGDRLTYIERFPEQYARFKGGQEQGQIGTPLAELPFLTESKRNEMRSVNIHTAEALAALPDRDIAKMGMGVRADVEQTRAWLDKASGSADLTRLSAENVELRERLARLEGELLKQPEEEDDFAGWSDADLKAHIKAETGSAPRGNPSHETLVALARETMAQAA